MTLFPTLISLEIPASSCGVLEFDGVDRDIRGTLLHGQGLVAAVRPGVRKGVVLFLVTFNPDSAIEV